jgi:hypothetical protein
MDGGGILTVVYGNLPPKTDSNLFFSYPEHVLAWLESWLLVMTLTYLKLLHETL